VKALIFNPTILASVVLSMVDQITFQTISIVIVAVTVVIGVANSIFSNGKEKKQREEQLIFQRSQGLSHEYFKAYTYVMAAFDWADAKEFRQKYDQNTNPEVNSKMVYVLYTYNLVGISLKRGADPDLIFQLYIPDTIIHIWELYEPITKMFREATNNPSFREPFEYLYTEAKNRQPQIKPCRPGR